MSHVIPAPSRLTIALEPAVSARLDRLAQREGKDAADIAAAAVADYVALHAMHVAEIEAAQREADAGDFATDTEVAVVFARWSTDRPRCRSSGGAQPCASLSKACPMPAARYIIPPSTGSHPGVPGNECLIRVSHMATQVDTVPDYAAFTTYWGGSNCLK